MDVIPLRTPPIESPRPIATNFAGLDAVRAFAALGVVLLHSGVPYLTHPMPGLAWPVQDTPSPLVDFGFWWIELFIMPLFLVIAGFLAWQTLQRRGPAALIMHRARRLLLPLSFAIVCILPMSLYSWLLGFVSEGIIEPQKLRSLKFEGGVDRDLWGLSHLWFLQYLFLYIAVLATVIGLRNRFGTVASRWTSLHALLAAAIVAGSVVIYVCPETIWGFQHAVAPVPSKWIYNGLFFAIGAAVGAHDPSLSWLKSLGSRLALPVCVWAMATVTLGQWHLSGGESQLADIALAIMTSTSSLGMSLGLIGVAVARIDRIPRVIGYFAAASFWIYLVHHPIVGLIHIDAKWWLPAVSPAVKTVAVLIISTALSLLTYESLVRRTAFGRLLGMAWEPPAQTRDRSSVDHVQVVPIGLPQVEAEDGLDTRRAA